MLTLSPIARSDIANHKLTKLPVFLREVAPMPGTCPNCAGIGALVLSFAKAGPFQYPPAGKDPITFADDRWWQVETKSYPCPVCTDISARRRHLTEQSGLQPNECHWRVDFLNGKNGKREATNKAHDIMAQSPHPVGWYLFHGDYGRGKSGVLKSIVAACVAADTSARYTTAAQILLEIRDTFGDDTPADEMELLNRYAKYQLLAIDEVDRVSDTSWARSTLFTLLNQRYDRRSECCTLLATNADPEAMPGGFEYLTSRMQDGVRVLVGGADLRGVK